MIPVRSSRESLPAGARATLEALATVAVPEGVPTKVWQSATDVAERTFYNHRSGLLEAGLVRNIGNGSRPRYIVAEPATTQEAEDEI